MGSVKTNLGHSEAASGITSIIKSTLILENGIVPPSFGVDHVNPKIKLADWNVEIVRERTPWPNEMMNRARRISVNSVSTQSWRESLSDRSNEDIAASSGTVAPTRM